ncbi:hypothetical protein QAD02_008322 [Eretmocerus hayati]|uniref:Uncharacterized protein n=1 Tax=Eretmocerus hayati TaxID=131215 RepID=A0ACC2NAJ5_9HYME|nr:hypothetical protein QAD02_008322 [Eretmocerus hayati]
MINLVCIHIDQSPTGSNCESLHGMTPPSQADPPLATEPKRGVSESQLSGSLYSGGGRYRERRSMRGFINIMTEELLATLDYCHISHRNASRLIIAVCHALVAVCNIRFPVESLSVCKTSMDELRSQMRKQLAERIKSYFGEGNLDIIVVHWHGKLIPDDASFKHVDRLPVLISSGEIVKILDVPALEDSQGVTQAYAIHRIDQRAFVIPSPDEFHPDLRQKIPELVAFIEKYIKECGPRDDYKELLELGLIRCGAVAPENVKFRRPRAFSHALFMGKGIYLLKLDPLPNAIPLKNSEKQAIRDLSKFITFVYVPAWSKAPLAIEAPGND